MTARAHRRRGEKRIQRRHLVQASFSLLVAATLALVGVAASPAAGSARRDVAAETLARNGLIAYESDIAGPLEVFVMHSDGSKKRRLTHSGHNGQPRWSPDGRKIVYVHGGCSNTGCNPATPSALWTMNADGSAKHRLTTGSSVDNDPRWSPDGKSIAFSRGTSCTNDGCHINIWLIRPDGTDARALTRDGRSAEPTWSPDETKIAFDRWDVSGSRTDLYVMKADGTSEHNVTSRVSVSSLDVASPAWSPDGRTIMFTPFGLFGSALAFISPNGTNLRSLDPFGSDSVGEPAWSPDGKFIVVQTQQTLWVGAFPPTPPAKRIAFDGDNHNPDWQPLPGNG
jgi:TolB protein